ncbi:MAG: hypothetical protein A3F09_02555 [Chlamydiae bacterium RIFCSPHIGHO2_12_FULL_49_11]|nr:MAG: hypothetical protein A3F09_02555 [Chlamydiae bacterium RIFCSPHIGHO2_12_FULL_49_11]
MVKIFFMENSSVCSRLFPCCGKFHPYARIEQKEDSEAKPPPSQEEMLRTPLLPPASVQSVMHLENELLKARYPANREFILENFAKMARFCELGIKQIFIGESLDFLSLVLIPKLYERVDETYTMETLVREIRAAMPATTRYIPFNPQSIDQTVTRFAVEFRNGEYLQQTTVVFFSLNHAEKPQIPYTIISQGGLTRRYLLFAPHAPGGTTPFRTAYKTAEMMMDFFKLLLIAQSKALNPTASPRIAAHELYFSSY